MAGSVPRGHALDEQLRQTDLIIEQVHEARKAARRLDDNSPAADRDRVSQEVDSLDASLDAEYHTWLQHSEAMDEEIGRLERALGIIDAGASRLRTTSPREGYNEARGAGSEELARAKRDQGRVRSMLSRLETELRNRPQSRESNVNADSEPSFGQPFTPPPVALPMSATARDLPPPLPPPAVRELFPPLTPLPEIPVHPPLGGVPPIPPRPLYP